MATAFSSFSTPIVSSTATNNPRKPESNRKSATQSNNWWTPLFGWSSEPDYVNNQNSNAKIETTQEVSVRREKNFRGRFTEEKAKELRKKTIESSIFHDIMYHSAIASRLASDVSERYDG